MDIDYNTVAQHLFLLPALWKRPEGATWTHSRLARLDNDAIRAWTELFDEVIPFAASVESLNWPPVRTLSLVEHIRYLCHDD